MPRTDYWAATDGTHWASDSMMEQLANLANYNIVDGCDYTPSGSDLDVDVASGTITHDGTQVTVAGSSVTLVADGTHPRWSWVCLNSSGTATLVSGTPAAAPTEPEVGDNVEVALFYVTAGATVASSLGHVPRRLMAPRDAETDANGLDSDVTTTSTTLGNVTGLSAALTANSTYVFKALIHYTAAAANDYKFSFTVPASSTIRAFCQFENTSAVETLDSITSSGGSLVANGLGTSTPGVVSVWGSVLTSGTAGNLQFQHALNASTGTVTTKAKSRLEVF